MKNILLLLTLIPVWGVAQDVELRALPDFEKIVIHPFIDVELDESDSAKIFIESYNWEPNRVITELKGKKLHVYLEGLKTLKVKDHNFPGRDVRVKVYIAYPMLKKISLRGDGDLICHGAVTSKKFKLKIYGDSYADFQEIQSGYFKSALFGDVHLRVREGMVVEQKLNAYGDVQVEADGLKTQYCAIRAFGDSDMEVSVSDQMRYLAFGDATVSYKGNPRLRKTILGDAHIRKIRP